MRALMTRIVPTLFALLCAGVAYAVDAEPPMPDEASVGTVAIFGILFVACCIWFVWYVWKGGKSDKDGTPKA
jgi:hypothetical protein